MGAVWVAWDEELQRDVAVKELTLPAELDESSRAELCERMVREARAAARLRHPSIVKVHDVVSEEGRPWIVMELLRGRTLQDLVRAGEVLPPERVARLGEQLLGALAAAHLEGIQHRDVKPANVFLCDDGRVVLTDFGIARMEGQVTITGSGMLIGSPGYIAPERLRGERGGPLSDLWSLGATLFAVVEGVAPFRAESPVVVLHRVLTQDAPVPRRAGPVLGPVLLRMLAREPGDRPDVATAARWLHDIAAGYSVRTPSPPSAPGVLDGPTSPTGAAAPARPLPAGTASTRGSAIRIVAMAVCVAGLAVVAALTWSGALWDRSSPDRSSPTPPAGGRSASEPVARATPTPAERRFTAPVDFCSLLSRAQAERIAAGAAVRRERDGDGCQWTARDVGLRLDPIRLPGLDEYWEGTSKDARDSYLSRRHVLTEPLGTHVWRWADIGMPRPLRVKRSRSYELNGIGDAAIVFNGYDPDTGTQVYSRAVFWIGNLAVEASYADLRPARAGRIRHATVTLARLAARNLDRRG